MRGAKQKENFEFSDLRRRGIVYHARIQKVLSEGVKLIHVFLFVIFLIDENISEAITGPPAKRHLNGMPPMAQH